MFKSAFSKYVFAFMVIIVLSFVAVFGITSTVIGRYSGDAKREIMRTSAQASSEYLSATLKREGKSLGVLAAEEGGEIKRMLSLVTERTGDITVILADSDGKCLLVAGEDESMADNGNVPDTVIKKLSEGEEYMLFGRWEKFFNDTEALYAVPVRDGNGGVCGGVLVCSDSVMMVELWELLLKVLMGSILWVSLATLIAVYFISARVMAPLREMSSAAKNFAAGKFDVRVPVRGSDEVAELAVAFNNMAESLDNYDNMRNQFMSDVSHDLRSPMTSIAGFVDGILDGVIPPEQHEYYLKIVSSEIKRLSRLVSTLLNLSRIQAGDRKFTMSEFDMCEMARQIIISFEQKINCKKLDVMFDAQEDRINVLADRDAIYQVLYNLCDNAVKFSSEGGKFIISIKRIKNKRKVEVRVFNEGQGIAANDMNYVFERFYKSDKSRGLNKSGAGLGLFISKTITDAHNEKIWVESEYGKNCCFCFTLAAE